MLPESSVIEFSDFDVTAEGGFLSPSPRRRLPATYKELEDLAEWIPERVAEDVLLFRQDIRNMSSLAVSDLSDKDEIRRALLLAHAIQNVYINGEPQRRHVPKNLAAFSCALSDALGFKGTKPLPVLTYSSCILDNWDNLDGSSFSRDMLLPLITFTNIPDEEGFIITHVLVEASAANGIQAINKIHQAIVAKIIDEICSGFYEVTAALCAMKKELLEMPTWCDPDVYYEQIRPWLQGFNGVVFMGQFGNMPQTYRGASGAQSSALAFFTEALGISYDSSHPYVKYLIDFERYMPPKHRALLRTIRETSIVREYVYDMKLSHPPIRNAYNECINSLVAFRKAHKEMIKPYVKRATSGTGNTPFHDWLEYFVRETEKQYL